MTTMGIWVIAIGIWVKIVVDIVNDKRFFDRMDEYR